MRALRAATLLALGACAARQTPGSSSGSGVPVCAEVGNPSGPPAYFEFQVDRPVQVQRRGTNATPATGRALVQFIVDTAGYPVASSFKVLESANPEAAAAAREIVIGSLFSPALKSGCRVNQVVHHPYVFR